MMSMQKKRFTECNFSDTMGTAQKSGSKGKTKTEKSYQK